jgi:DNA-directed RNA polymerase subunit RPC12/RpoP
MTRQPKCPVCDRVLPLPLPSVTDTFRCPHCGERLRVVQYGTSARRVLDVVVVAAMIFGGYRLGWRGELTLALVIVAAVVLLNGVMFLFSGYKLEPAGRAALGESDPGS